jgi:septum formation protein
MFEIILASQSPRRRQLLEDAGFIIRVHSLKVSETIEENLNPLDFVATLARRKAHHFVHTSKPSDLNEKLVISADTVVVLDEQILGKPENNQQAVQYLRSLSGRTHSVITGVTLVPDGLWSSEVTFTETTNVYFHALTDPQIEAYVQSGEPMDKAGAYAIQGEGRHFVQKYEGSWSNVVGLPMERLEDLISKRGWHVRRKQS